MVEIFIYHQIEGEEPALAAAFEAFRLEKRLGIKGLIYILLKDHNNAFAQS